MAVLGINYSKQIEDKKGLFINRNILTSIWGGFSTLLWHDYRINNGKGSTIKLTNEMAESNNLLGKKIR